MMIGVGCREGGEGQRAESEVPQLAITRGLTTPTDGRGAGGGGDGRNGGERGGGERGENRWVLRIIWSHLPITATVATSQRRFYYDSIGFFYG